MTGQLSPAVPAAEAAGPSDEELLELVSWSGHAFASDLVGFARAVLARYGPTPPRPVPVAERLPGPEDCDAEGSCWWYAENPGWELFHRDYWLAKHTHWMPAHALPLPAQEGADG